ncbi:hypothetical protein [Burkholderia glumae]
MSFAIRMPPSDANQKKRFATGAWRRREAWRHMFPIEQWFEQKLPFSGYCGTAGTIDPQRARGLRSAGNRCPAWRRRAAGVRLRRGPSGTAARGARRMRPVGRRDAVRRADGAFLHDRRGGLVVFSVVASPLRRWLGAAHGGEGRACEAAMPAAAGAPNALPDIGDRRRKRRRWQRDAERRRHGKPADRYETCNACFIGPAWKRWNGSRDRIGMVNEANDEMPRRSSGQGVANARGPRHRAWLSGECRGFQACRLPGLQASDCRSRRPARARQNEGCTRYERGRRFSDETRSRGVAIRSGEASVMEAAVGRQGRDGIGVAGVLDVVAAGKAATTSKTCPAVARYAVEVGEIGPGPCWVPAVIGAKARRARCPAARHSASGACPVCAAGGRNRLHESQFTSIFFMEFFG